MEESAVALEDGQGEREGSEVPYWRLSKKKHFHMQTCIWYVNIHFQFRRTANEFPTQSHSTSCRGP